MSNEIIDKIENCYEINIEEDETLLVLVSDDIEWDEVSQLRDILKDYFENDDRIAIVQGVESLYKATEVTG